MKTAYWLLALAAAIAATAVVTRRSAPPSEAPAAANLYQPVGSIRSIMEGIVEPTSDVIYQSVAVIATASGTVEHVPRTDEEWARVEHNALALAESANLLKMPRIVATPEEEKEPVQEGALTPKEIGVRIDANRAEWNTLVDGLLKAALRARDAASKHDMEGLYDVGGVIDAACETCHIKLWYPDAVKYLRPIPQH
jgi:hypothetical protein